MRYFLPISYNLVSCTSSEIKVFLASAPLDRILGDRDPGPSGWGIFFLSRGMASLEPESLLLGLKTWYTNGSSSRMQTMHSNSFSG